MRQKVEMDAVDKSLDKDAPGPPDRIDPKLRDPDFLCCHHHPLSLLALLAVLLYRCL